MTERELLKSEIQDNLLKITYLQGLNRALKYRLLTICDLEQQYEERLETHKGARGEKEFVENLTGRIFWLEQFTDGSTGETISIQRTKIVKINGAWTV